MVEDQGNARIFGVLFPITFATSIGQSSASGWERDGSAGSRPSVDVRLTSRRPRAGPLLHHVTIKRFMITIQAPTWQDVEDVELPRLPTVGETIETKYGTCLVTQTEASSGTAPYQGKIVCRFP